MRSLWKARRLLLDLSREQRAPEDAIVREHWHDDYALARTLSFNRGANLLREDGLHSVNADLHEVVEAQR